jgi:hypothetical protein
MIPGTCKTMLEKIRAIKLEDVAGSVIDGNLEKLKALNIGQMMKGKNNKGEFFSPTHSDNPFFKSPEAGLAYARFKQRLFPDSPFNIANFRITGYYHETVSFSRRGNVVAAESNASFADKIQSEFKDTTLGLNPESHETAWNDVIKSHMLRILADKIGCDVSQ